MFERLKKAVNAEYDTRAKEQRYFIENGYTKSNKGENPTKKDEGIFRYATTTTAEAYKGGKITRAEAVKRATAKMERDNEKNRAAAMEKIAEAENAPDLASVDVQIEWKKSRTWGANPFCECWGGGYYTTGHASGCGYDKRTAATAAAFNSNPAIMKALYTAEEKRLAKRNKPTRRDFIGYGSGYGILPAFEGGVGITSHGRIFENIGFTFKTTADTRTSDAYTITRKTKKEN